MHAYRFLYGGAADAFRAAKARRLPKIVGKSLSRGQLLRQKPDDVKPGLHGARVSFSQKKEAGVPIFQYFGSVGSALLVLLFVSDACLRDSENDTRFDGSLYQSALYAPLPADTPAELRYTRDATPSDRVKDVFAQFVPNEGRRGKRYSSLART